MNRANQQNKRLRLTLKRPQAQTSYELEHQWPVVQSIPDMQVTNQECLHGRDRFLQKLIKLLHYKAYSSETYSMNADEQKGFLYLNVK